MSGGYFNYEDRTLKNRIFGYACESSRQARADNRLEDKVVSEIAYDIFNVLHAYDYYQEGDKTEEEYRKAVKKFKDKWFSKKFNEKYCRELVSEECEMLRKQLLSDLDVRPISEGYLETDESKTKYFEEADEE